MTAIANRYEFVLLFDVENGNPNGDPDAGNMPRIDPETGHGLVTDVCLKRKIRNHVALARGGVEGFNIYVQEKAVLNQTNELAYKAYELKPEAKKLPKKVEDAQKVTGWMCANFFDIRSFGAVMTTEVNCGQVRGPVQLAFAKSIEPIVPQEISITRMAVTNEKDLEKERTMGRKHIVPYGLYVAQGFVSAPLAEKTGFSEDDLNLLWEALINMFEHDRSAARGLMSSRKLVVFRHDSKMGNAPAHKLFDLVEIRRNNHTEGPARSFKDYDVRIDAAPSGVEIIEKL
ncbi:type I-C CRISPR-associated protein Cas7/Csd2 [Geoalkalibacter halelectricus]|uniref:Type I-C CRISPR-associated protein Cas7/Csd2 n=1 Tax=Geoalkalibacter halelectricus TaxID=2847045 RepID=A0ABY5ZUS9_9BACT|nr:type I-C CRISPR-associated protein Cas7/Csd2 [Geoalkalibacter halelectricus]MDO3377603.1 type I-C CRISPR-associated protein Cas7/Csd2 [Geoalkalibacter halelectricus]UWZ81394.1 type I-C CRISPR-associated protein Cas7/Csd2 [Geoalkalibacter halelectricus]